ncbi:hypothetical protein B7Y94_05630 [Candidatus Saccharibacteria bacterium 32-49-12]|nr:MAG: hypothetical protein B7Y94_05630 [Candidatus Saccharibacteria bacterium 32-49-12]
MATSKTKKKVATAKPAPKKAKTAAQSAKTTVTRVTSAPSTTKKTALGGKPKLPSNLINIVLAESIGTFVLTLVAIVATSYFMLPFYIGLVMVVMVLAIGAISGSHINPAVTFGLWTMRRIRTALVPFYWIAQLLGAMAAIVLVGAVSGGVFSISFENFLDFSWSIFALELVGTAIFMFGFAAVINRTDVRSTGRAIGLGMSLTIGLVATGALVSYAQSNAVARQQAIQAEAAADDQNQPQEGERSYPREVYINGATLNPAIALATTERTDSQLQGNPTVQKDEVAYTRLGIEVILATLIGAALGGNLFLLVNYRSQIEA